MNWKEIEWHYVNLDSRPDRRVHAENEFAKHDIEAQRFGAYLPEAWPDFDRARVQRMQNRTPGAIGCFYSQITLIKRAAETGKVIAVCEDDVCFCSDLPKRLQHIQDNLKWDWDVFYLGATFHVPGKWCHKDDCKRWSQHEVDADPTIDKHIMRVYGEWGTYAYLVNPANARKVYRLLMDNCAISDGIDHNFIRLGDKVNAYCFVPGCAWQYDNQSNIGNDITRFSGFKRLGPYAWTERMEDFDPASFDWVTGKEKHGNQIT